VITDERRIGLSKTFSADKQADHSESLSFQTLPAYYISTQKLARQQGVLNKNILID
jgi:hypothetical protein